MRIGLYGGLTHYENFRFEFLLQTFQNVTSR